MIPISYAEARALLDAQAERARAEGSRATVQISPATRDLPEAVVLYAIADTQLDAKALEVSWATLAFKLEALDPDYKLSHYAGQWHLQLRIKKVNVTPVGYHDEERRDA